MSDEEIGYAKPPKSGQFKKGKSGNPKGRPKAKKRLIVADCFENVLAQEIPVMVDGKRVYITLMEAMTRRLCMDAANGNHAAMRTALAFMTKLGVGKRPAVEDLLQPMMDAAWATIADEEDEEETDA